MLVKFSRSGATPAVPIVGLNYKDQIGDAKAWLTRFGNPYVLSAVDLDGRVGVVGVEELLAFVALRWRRRR